MVLDENKAKKILFVFLRTRNRGIQIYGPGYWYRTLCKYWLDNLSASNKAKWDAYWDRLKEEARKRER